MSPNSTFSPMCQVGPSLSICHVWTALPLGFWHPVWPLDEDSEHLRVAFHSGSRGSYTFLFDGQVDWDQVLCSESAPHSNVSAGSEKQPSVRLPLVLSGFSEFIIPLEGSVKSSRSTDALYLAPGGLPPARSPQWLLNCSLEVQEENSSPVPQELLAAAVNRLVLSNPRPLGPTGQDQGLSDLHNWHDLLSALL